MRPGSVYNINDRLEAVWFVRAICQDFSVQVNACSAEAVLKLGVRHVVLAYTRVDLLDPQPSPPLFLRSRTCTADPFPPVDRQPVAVLGPATIALGELKHLLRTGRILSPLSNENPASAPPRACSSAFLLYLLIATPAGPEEDACRTRARNTHSVGRVRRECEARRRTPSSSCVCGARERERSEGSSRFVVPHEIQRSQGNKHKRKERESVVRSVVCVCLIFFIICKKGLVVVGGSRRSM